MSHNKRVIVTAQLIQKLAKRLDDEYDNDSFVAKEILLLIHQLAQALEGLGENPTNDFRAYLYSAACARDLVHSYMLTNELPSEWAMPEEDVE